ncbi:MAG TPA: protein translocase subunit SecD [Nocardioides sp.]|uniref:protein translocase subunit SecD n=1 Tax=Nocardioides sp. TaxID=35761 RepID=UPI002F3E2C00
MARSSSRPGRTVAVFFIGLAVAYGLVALVGTWKPALGLDLEGGTQITLIANGSVSKDNLNQAADIINERVNGSGVSEAEVTTQGSNEIVVQVPGPTGNSLVQTVLRQARLRFRLVAQVPQTGQQAPLPSASPSQSPGSGVTLPPSSAPTTSGKSSTPKADSTGKNRGPALLGTQKDTKKKAKPSSSPTATPGGAPLSTSKVHYTEANKKAFADALTWMTNPDPQSVAVYNAYTCPSKTPVVDLPNIPIVTCDAQGQKYLLSPAQIEGTEISSASANAPGTTQGQVQWTVGIQLKSHGADIQRRLSQAMAGDQSKTFAIVLDGQVISAPYFESVISDGTSQITGNFSESEAKSLATSLKYGALPISFDKNKTTVEVIGPSLAGDQLSAGITAGIAGLALVMIYCLFYYRGLGLVVIASLLVAGGTTYAMVLLLAKSAGFTLTLPGIAGLIVAVGITADSFIVFFERIRDEMRSGKSMRVAVEAGWIRARATCVAADAVSILAAVVLYIFAAGVVKGFAFALGLSTIIDLAVFFWFTKPMVSWLARFAFFNKGHKLSGLDAENLGLDRLPAGGRA